MRTYSALRTSIIEARTSRMPSAKLTLSNVSTGSTSAFGWLNGVSSVPISATGGNRSSWVKKITISNVPTRNSGIALPTSAGTEIE